MSNITVYVPGEAPRMVNWLNTLEAVEILGGPYRSHAMLAGHDLDAPLDGVLLVNRDVAHVHVPSCRADVAAFRFPCIHVPEGMLDLLVTELLHEHREILAVALGHLELRRAVLILVGQLTEFIEVAELARHYLVDSAMGRFTRDALTAQSEDARKAIRIARGGEP